MGLRQAVYAKLELGVGGGDGVMVVASPPALAGRFEAGLEVGECLLGLVST